MNKHIDVMYTNPCVYTLLGLFFFLRRHCLSESLIKTFHIQKVLSKWVRACHNLMRAKRALILYKHIYQWRPSVSHPTSCAGSYACGGYYELGSASESYVSRHLLILYGIAMNLKPPLSFRSDETNPAWHLHKQAIA